MAITDHAAVELCIRPESNRGTGARWRMKNKISFGQILKSFFDMVAQRKFSQYGKPLKLILGES